MKNPTKKKYKFINKIWVTGFFNDLEIIGRTCLINNEEMVIIIDENSKSMVISYHEIIGLNKFSFTKHTEQKNEKLENENFKSSLNQLLAKNNIKYNYQQN